MNNFNKNNSDDKLINYKPVEIQTTNNIIRSICLGESKNYIISLMSAPRFEFLDNGLCNSFFPLEHIIVRCVFDKNDVLIGYFITAKEENTSIEIYDPIDEDKRLVFGQDTYDTFSYADSIKEGSIANGGLAQANTYYWEYTYLCGTGKYQNYVVADFPYGFGEAGAISIMGAGENPSKYADLLESYRKTFHPNTYGIVDPKYMDMIKPYIQDRDLEVLWVSCVDNLCN